MKESLWGYYLVLLGIMVSSIMILVSNMTTTNQQNYYLLKEVTNAAMIDSIDFGYYRKYGEMKINTEKFVENFLRRFSQGISKNNTYKIDFYSIYENPPSVSIKITSNTGDYRIAGDNTNIDVINSIDAVLEANSVISTSEIFYSIPYASCSEENYVTKSGELNKYCQLVNRAKFNLDTTSKIYKNLSTKLGKSTLSLDRIKISSVEYLSIMSNSDDLLAYKNNYSSTYKREASLDDVPADLSYDESRLAKNIKNVKITVKNDTDGAYFLAYGLNFNCDGASTYKYYRKKGYTSVTDMEYITESVYNGLSDTSKANYDKAPFYDNCLVGIKYKVNFYYDES